MQVTGHSHEQLTQTLMVFQGQNMLFYLLQPFIVKGQYDTVLGTIPDRAFGLFRPRWRL